jgi:hypothetical protein
MGLFTKSEKKQAGQGVSIPMDIDSLLSKVVDRRRDALYDRVWLRAGSFMPSIMWCFQVPVGRNDPFRPSHVKDFVDTNMWASGQLNVPHDFIVRRFLFLFQPSTAEADRNAVLAAYKWDFKILEKVMNQEPVLVSAASGKPENLIENFGKGSWLDDKGNRENDSLSKIEKLGVGICWDLGEGYEKYLPSLLQFAVILQGQPFELQADLDFYVMIDGLRDWAVQ